MKTRLGLLLVVLLVTSLPAVQSAYAQDPVLNDFVILGGGNPGLPPVLQVVNKADGSVRASAFVLNQFITFFFVGSPDVFAGVDEPRILVCGQDFDFNTGMPQGPPVFQLYTRDLAHLVTRFALNANFSIFACNVIDVEDDGVEEIVIYGVDSTNINNVRHAVQVYTQTGQIVYTRFYMRGDIQFSFPVH